MDYEYDYNDFPIAYLITFRTYGTWLHGDEKLSIDRRFNIYGTPKRDANPNLKKEIFEELRHDPFILTENQRELVKIAIEEVCEHRSYKLQAINVRSNHVHAVVSAEIKSKFIINAFKSYSTRKLRENFLAEQETKIWARGGSRRYLWKSRFVALAIEYVLYGQGDIIPAFDGCVEFDD